MVLAEASDPSWHGAPVPTFEVWSFDGSTRSVFTHVPTGTRIALPVSGPWIYNPADPRIVACDELHAVLHAP